MPKRLLFIEDLYDFYVNKYQRSTHFDADKYGAPIVVQARGNLTFSGDNKDTEGLLPVHLQSCHIDRNINGSFISKETMESAIPSFKNRPILGYIHKVVTNEHPDGQWEFYNHAMHLDENGDEVYDEFPVGIIPESCNAKLIYDEEKGHTYCEVDGYIYEVYSRAAEILQRESECPVSVELSVRKLSYNAKEKCLNLEDFFFSGVTILGKTPDGRTVNPGMEKSNIKLKDFSAENNSLFENLDKKIGEIKDRLSELETVYHKNFEKGGNPESMNKFNELLEKYGKAESDITFEYEGLSDEELEAKFEEVFAEVEKTPEPKTPETFENIVRTYEISHEDVRYALYNLLSAYEETDNEWYFINSVYDNYFTYENWGGDKIYGQNYVKENDVVSFSGERYNLHRELLTDSEYAELQSMRANYEALKQFKEDTENKVLHEQRESLINSDKYSVLAEKNESGEYVNEKFSELVKNMDNYSLTDLEMQIKILHSDFISEHAKFESNNTSNRDSKTPVMRIFNNPNSKVKTKKRYGNLFD